MGGHLGGHVGMAILALASRAVDAVVGIVDAVRDQLLADPLPHRPVVPVPFARIEFQKQRAVGQHHLPEGERSILTDDHPAGRDGLEVFAVSRRVLRKEELVSCWGQHPQIDRVQQQFGGGADREFGEISAEFPSAKRQREARSDPRGGEHATPGIHGIGKPLILELTFQDPLAPHEHELEKIVAGDGGGSVAVVDRRRVGCPGTDSDHLLLEVRVRGQVDVAHPLAVSRLDLDDRARPQPLEQERGAGVAELFEVALRVDGRDGAVSRGERDPLLG